MNKSYPEEYVQLAARLRHIDNKDMPMVQYYLKLSYPDVAPPDRKTIRLWVDRIYGKKVEAATKRIETLTEYPIIDFSPSKTVSKFFASRKKAKKDAIINAALETLIKTKSMPEELYRKRDLDDLEELAEEEQLQQSTNP